jgi:hypothetical protein
MLAAIVLSVALAAPPESGPPKLTLKNGTVFRLKEPPRIAGGRIVFETVDGKFFSIAESEVATIGMTPPPTATPKYSAQDSRALGAIARQQRSRRGKSAEVAPRAPRRPTRTPAVRRRVPTPAPRAR